VDTPAEPALWLPRQGLAPTAPKALLNPRSTFADRGFFLYVLPRKSVGADLERVLGMFHACQSPAMPNSSFNNPDHLPVRATGREGLDLSPAQPLSVDSE